jgi:F420-dependent oxidoreductase-like protein
MAEREVRMRLALNLGYSGSGMKLNVDLVRRAEALGFDSVWSAEAYGSDAVTPLAYLAALTGKIKLGTAIMQMPARTPAMTAMTAMTLDQLSGGRFILGLGPSGPQVVEGWHGVPYGKPLERTREYVEIIRQILAREKPVEHHGEHYDIPNTGPGTTGLGKPLKSILHGRKDLPIFTASIGPAGIRTSGEVADGLIPVWMNPERMDLILPFLSEGIAKAGGGKRLADFRIAPFVTCVLGDDLEKCRMPIKGMLSLYVGGMGARGKNFYNDYAKRLGYEAEAKAIQDLYLDGKKLEALAAVPDRFVDEIALVGPAGRIRERVAAWKASGVSDLILGAGQPEALELLAKEVL